VSDEVKASRKQACIDLATTQAFANIDVSEMLALATIAESRKSIDSMRAILIRAFKVARHVRKLDLRALRREFKPKELADRYMEARYAIRPLMYDAKGIAATINKNMSSVRRTYRGFSEDNVEVNDTAYNVDTSLWGTVADWSLKSTYEVSARAGILCDVSHSIATTLGTNQIFETAWELLPFSFIMDWFANTGDWIAAVTPNAGVKQRASWIVVREKSYQESILSASRSTASQNGYFGISCAFSPAFVTVTESSVDRQTELSVPLLPSTRLRLDGYKLTDLGIILRKVLS
jgi:hypothetical protein